MHLPANSRRGSPGASTNRTSHRSVFSFTTLFHPDNPCPCTKTFSASSKPRSCGEIRGFAPFLQPGLDPAAVATQLKSAGYRGNIEPILELYAWHDGTSPGAPKAVDRLGFAPPTVSDPPAANLEFMRSRGHKVPAAFNEIYANLSIANMEFGDFAKTVGADGVYRGMNPD
jgi:hypothetical protein